MNSINCEEQQQEGEDKFIAKPYTEHKTILVENEPTFGFNLPINMNENKDGD